MLSVNAHGGRCCGSYHIHGFSSNDRQNVTDLEVAISRVMDGRNVDIILNGNQMRSLPLTLQKMADLGFVLTAQYQNDNHGSRNFIFHRAQKRFRIDNVTQWPGQVIQPTMRGNLSGLFNHFNQPQANPRFDEYNGIRVGDLVRIRSPRSVHNQEHATVVRFHRIYYYGTPRATLTNANGVFDITPSNLVLVQRAAPVAPVVPERPALPPQLHEV